MLERSPAPQSDILKLDDRPVPRSPGEIRCFVCLKNEALRLPHFLEHHRELGIDRFFFIDNGSTDGSREFLLSQGDCHTFHCGGNYFAENVVPPSWTNVHLNLFGHGHWSLTVDPDELLVYPHCEHVTLREFCHFLERSGADALFARMIDMYAKGPITKSRYKAGQPFVKAAPYFDTEPGWIKPLDGQIPPKQLFGGVRERVFWRGKYKRGLPPCISKVPLVKWRKGMRYLASMHLISHAILSEVEGALLHFKFLTGFVTTMTETVSENTGVAEKGLEERASYIDALKRNPKLSLWHEASARYRDTKHLVDLDLMRSSTDYEAYVRKQAPAGVSAAPPRPTGGAKKSKRRGKSSRSKQASATRRSPRT